MALVSESWYLRLPDGRVVLAKSSRAVRHHLRTGRIPANSRIRRSPGDEWLKLDSVPEFAELVAQPSSRDVPLPGPRENEAANGRPSEFGTLGASALVGELLNAVDSSLNRHKLLVAAIASLTWAIGVLGYDLLPSLSDGIPSYVYRCAIALGLLFLGGLASAILGQMTLVELSRFRPARWHEVRAGLILKAFRIMLGQGFLLALVLAPLVAIRHFSEAWTPTEGPTHSVQATVLALRLVLEVIFWPLAGMSLLIAPLLLVEECSLPSALAQWWDMLWSDLGRIFLYETLAAGLGIVLTFPLTLPVLYASWTFVPGGHDLVSASGLATLHVLGGFAVTPLVAYLLVANVFIYLNLKYEFLFPNGR